MSFGQKSVIKLLLDEKSFFIAGVKLLLLCDLFTQRKNELSREERHEIIRYAKSRLPIFLTQLHRFLQALKNTFCSMSASQRHEVAAYLVPEVIFSHLKKFNCLKVFIFLVD